MLIVLHVLSFCFIAETLSQLHGTGLYFKKSLGGNKGVLEKFPNIEEQIQIRKLAHFKYFERMNQKSFNP